MSAVRAEALRQIHEEVFQIGGAETRIAVAAGLLLVGEDGHGRVNGLLDVECRRECRIGANPVVMTVDTDQAAVKADLLSRECRYCLQLRREKIRLHDAVLLVQELHET